MKKVSIIIPIYNAEKYIEKCLQSIMYQTYKNIEIIAVNDGSTDNTRQLIEIYKKKDERIKAVNQKNLGVSTARNNGIKISTGEYIMFIDGDDYLEKNMVEEMMNAQKKHDVEVVRCNYYLESDNKMKKADMYELSNVKVKKENYSSKKVLEHFLLEKERMSNLVMLLIIKKEVLIRNSIKFNKDLYMMEDVLFYQEVLNSVSSIYFLDKPLYHYVDNPNSVTKSKDKYEKMIFGIIDSNSAIKKYLRNNNLFQEKINMMDANHLRIIFSYLFYYYKQYGINGLKILIEKTYCNEKFNKMLDNAKSANTSKKLNTWIHLIDNRKYTYLKIAYELKKLKGDFKR